MPDVDTIRATLARIPNPIAVLESLFALAPVGFQIYEASGRSILVNQAFLDLFGSEPPPGYNVLEDEIAAKNGVLDLIQRAFKGETITTPTIWYDPRELRSVKVEQGRRVAMSATFFPLFDRRGTVTHVAIVFKDMTAEVTQREQLEHERELLAAIVDQVSEGIIMADAQGVIRLANSAARELGVRTGVPAERWASEHHLRRGDGTPAPLEDIPLWRAVKGEASQGVIHVRKPDGSLRALACSAVPLRRADGTLRGAVVTTRDETDRLRRDEELAQAGHFRERFIGILGHDLRSPLTAIVASAGLLLRHRDSSDPILGAAARINNSAERMGRMIGDLLDFTQARLGGGLAVQRRHCDLAQVAAAVVDEVSAANPGRTIRVETDGEVAGSFDPDRTAQLLSNLLANAVAYAPPDDRISVRLTGFDEAVEIAVENGGEPIPESERASLFDPFRRGRTSQASRGLGLGLFIVQQIARAHDGDVEIESVRGRTVFRAHLQR